MGVQVSATGRKSWNLFITIRKQSSHNKSILFTSITRSKWINKVLLFSLNKLLWSSRSNKSKKQFTLPVTIAMESYFHSFPLHKAPFGSSYYSDPILSLRAGRKTAEKVHFNTILSQSIKLASKTYFPLKDDYPWSSIPHPSDLTKTLWNLLSSFFPLILSEYGKKGTDWP